MLLSFKGDIETLMRVTKDALSVVHAMSNSDKYVHRKLYCEHLIRMQLERLTTILTSERMFRLYSILDLSQPIPSCIVSLIAMTMIEILDKFNLSSCNYTLAVEILRNSKSIEGGPLTSLFQTSRLHGRACIVLVDIMRDTLSMLHHLVLAQHYDTSSEEISMCSMFISWQPSLLLKQDCNNCTPMDYRHDPFIMEKIITTALTC